MLLVTQDKICSISSVSILSAILPILGNSICCLGTSRQHTTHLERSKVARKVITEINWNGVKPKKDWPMPLIIPMGEEDFLSSMGTTMASVDADIEADVEMPDFDIGF